MFKVVKLFSYCLNALDPLIIPLVLFFYLVVKGIMITKNSVVKIQNLAVHHESRPVKWNPEMVGLLDASLPIWVPKLNVQIKQKS